MLYFQLIPITRYVTELLYIHSKVMIVDDRRVIVSGIISILYYNERLISTFRWVPLTSMIEARKVMEILKLLLSLKIRT